MTTPKPLGTSSVFPLARADERTVVRSAALPPVLLTEDEAAAVLGVSKRTFLSLRTQPWFTVLPIVLGPRMLRWSLDELRAAVAGMPRQTERVQPEGLLRARIDKMKNGAAV